MLFRNTFRASHALSSVMRCLSTGFVISDRPTLSLKHLKSFRAALFSKDFPNILEQMNVIQNCNDDVEFDNAPDALYQPLVEALEVFPKDNASSVGLLRTLSKLNFTWENHHTLILAQIEQFYSEDFREVIAFIDSVSDLADWDMIPFESRGRIFQMIENSLKEHATIENVIVLLNTLSEFDAKWYELSQPIRDMIVRVVYDGVDAANAANHVNLPSQLVEALVLLESLGFVDDEMDGDDAEGDEAFDEDDDSSDDESSDSSDESSGESSDEEDETPSKPTQEQK